MLEKGALFGKYRIISLLGRGGTGSVYLAEDERLGRPVALKVLDRALTRTASFEELLQREARLIASIEHPHIVRIHSLEHVGEDLAIDMMYMKGGSFADALRRGDVSPLMAVTSSIEILSALAVCHASGIVHRDVKPANILLDEGGRSLLSDFGLAKLLAIRHGDSFAASASSEFFVGTPRYAPPEAWDGAEPTSAWDVYSIGMVLFEALGGQLPYNARAPLAYMKQLLECPVPRLEPETAGVSRELVDAIAAMLERESEARPQDASEALDVLRRAPEYVQAQDRDAVTLRGSLPRLPRARRLKFKPPRFISARGGVLVSVAVTLTILGAAAGGYAMRGGAFGSKAADAKPHVFAMEEISSESGYQGQVLVSPGETTGESRLLVSNAAGLWYLRGKAIGADMTAYEGHWAEYGDANARIFRYGTVKGSGRRHGEGSELLSLKFVSSQDGSRQSRSVFRSLTTSTSVDSFLLALKSSDYLQPLVYNELFPRRLSWADELEKSYLCSSDGPVGIPFLGSRTVGLDGSLEDSAWDTSRGVVASPTHPSARMLLRYDREALYIGLRCAGISRPPQVDFGLISRFDVPFDASPRWRARFSGETLVASNCTSAGSSVPWDCKWEAAGSTRGAAWEMEVRVPFGSVDSAEKPESGIRWRLCCSVADAASKRVLAGWGGDPRRVEAGTIIVFGD